MRVIKEFLDNISAQLALETAELNAGRTLVQSLEAEERLRQLGMVARSPEKQADLLEMAIYLGQLGIGPWDVEDMARLWLQSQRVEEAYE